MATPRHTRVTEVYDALLSLVRAEPEIEPPFLVDGGASLNDYTDYVVMFGFRPDAEEWISVSRAATGGLAPNDIETITIGVLIAATDADHNMQAARALVASKFAAVERVVTGNPTLGLSGVVATIPAHAWQPLHTVKGAECNLSADVVVKATL